MASREPGPGPNRRCLIKAGGEVFGHGGQQDVPPLLADQGRLFPEKAQLSLDRLPAVLLKKLPDVLPPGLLVDVVGHATSELSDGHRVVGMITVPWLVESPVDVGERDDN